MKEREVFQDNIKDELESLTSELMDEVTKRAAKTSEAMEAHEATVRISIEMKGQGGQGSARFIRDARLLIWKDEAEREQLMKDME